MKRAARQKGQVQPVVTRHFDPKAKRPAEESDDFDIPTVLLSDDENERVPAPAGEYRRLGTSTKRIRSAGRDVGAKSSNERKNPDERKNTLHDERKNFPDERQISSGSTSTREAPEELAIRRRGPLGEEPKNPEEDPRKRRVKPVRSTQRVPLGPKVSNPAMNIPSVDSSERLRQKLSSIESRIKQNIQNIKERGRYRLSLRSSQVDVRDQMQLVDSADARRQAQLEEIKAEILVNKIEYPVSVIRNISELRQEIASYRVNLNDKVGEAMLKLGSLDRDKKEESSQRDVRSAHVETRAQKQNTAGQAFDLSIDILLRHSLVGLHSWGKIKSRNISFIESFQSYNTNFK